MVEVAGYMRCEAIAWVTEDWPGWVRVRLIDAAERPWFFVDKVPIFFSDESAGRLSLPAPAVIRCRIIGRDSGGILTVSTATPDGVAAEDGTFEFRVRAEQVTIVP